MAWLDDGFEIIENVLADDDIRLIKNELAGVECTGAGLRNADKKLNAVATLIASEKITSLAAQYLDKIPHHVRSIIFNKSMDNNWTVAWHQDKTVAVTKPFEHLAWGPWSKKEGVLHVQPPLDVLEQMVTVRLQLDDATVDNGCLKVLPGSHTNGLLSAADIQNIVQHHKAIHCVAPEGSALVMRPLLLHASNKLVVPQPRRVLHMEFSSYLLPLGIRWA